MTQETPIYLRPKAAAEVVGVHRATLYRWAEQGHIRIHRKGNASFVRISELIAYVESEPVEVTPQRKRRKAEQGKRKAAS